MFRETPADEDRPPSQAWRVQLPRDAFVPIKKGEQYYVGVKYYGAILVVDPSTYELVLDGESEEMLPGLRMEHFLFPSINQKRYLDLMSLHPNKVAFPVLFSFLNVSGNALTCPSVLRLSSTIEHYPDTKILYMLGHIYIIYISAVAPPGGTGGGRAEDLALAFMHEIGHTPRWQNGELARLFNTKQLVLAEEERYANAFALAIARSINKQYRSDEVSDKGFFNLEGWRRTVQRCLTTYDPESLDKPPQTVEEAKDLLRKRASNSRRRPVREMILILSLVEQRKKETSLRRDDNSLDNSERELLQNDSHSNPDF